MAHRRVNTTKLEIIRAATGMFLEKGYTATSVKAIADTLDMSTGHLTFYFPTKEHLLAELVDKLCTFQWAQVRTHYEESGSLLMAVCLELTAMAAICEENEIARDFYLASYTHPMTLEIIRRNDARRAKAVFGEYCGGWTDTQHAEAEILISGIEYATLMTTGDSAPIDVRIAGALNNIMQIYQVPEEIRREKIAQVLALDYAAVGRQMLADFIRFIEDAAEQAFEEMFQKQNGKKGREPMNEKNKTPMAEELDDDALEAVAGGVSVGDSVRINPRTIVYCPNCSRLINHGGEVSELRGTMPDGTRIFKVRLSCCGYEMSAAEFTLSAQ